MFLSQAAASVLDLDLKYKRGTAGLSCLLGCLHTEREREREREREVEGEGVVTLIYGCEAINTCSCGSCGLLCLVAWLLRAVAVLA
jgi:hypothetical protein